MGRHLTSQEKKAICMDRMAGVQRKVLAEKYGVDPRTISRIWRDFREGAAEGQSVAVEKVNSSELKSVLKKRASSAVEEGLKTKEEIVGEGGKVEEYDRYKAAGLGVKVLEGIGEFQKSVQHSHFHRLESLPEDWKERYGYVSTIEVEAEEAPMQITDGSEET